MNHNNHNNDHNHRIVVVVVIVIKGERWWWCQCSDFGSMYSGDSVLFCLVAQQLLLSHSPILWQSAFNSASASDDLFATTLIQTKTKFPLLILTTTTTII